MGTRRALQSLVLAACFGAFATIPANAQTPQQGTIAGRVTDVGSGQPIGAAQVNVVGGTQGGLTNSDGQYVIRGVRPGAVEVRSMRIGYAEQRRSATVTAGQSVTVNFLMQSVAVTLNPVVTTATGEQRRVEVGNAIAQVSASAVVEQRGISDVGDLLTARAPGMLVVPGTQTGAGIRVRIRGTSSLSLSNNPIYILDGIRVEGTTGSSSVSVGGTTTARVNDLNPEEIESIEVVRGPSAATLYGTDAANGVIVITTKRGVAGRPQVTYSTEEGEHVDNNHYPTAYRGWRSGTSSTTTSLPGNTVQCFLSQVVAKACVQDSVTSYNVHDDPHATPNGAGLHQQHSLQVGGGSEALRYFLHGEWEDEAGVFKVPLFDQRYMAAHSLTLSPEEQTPNHLSKYTTRANFNLSPSPKVDVAFSTGYIASDTRLPMSDDSGTNGIMGNTTAGLGYKYNLSPAGDTLYGWKQFTPRDIYQQFTNQAIARSITSINSSYRPTEWLSARGNFGLDYTNRVDVQMCKFGDCPDQGGTSKLGYRIDNRTNFFTYTADGSATATNRLTNTLISKLTGGVQFNRSVFSENLASSSQLPPGATSVSAGAIPLASESTSDTRTLGSFLEENLAFNDRLFVTGAVRTDKNSAFGVNFKTAIYPKVAVSWVASEEPFFPRFNWLNQLRLRSAYGASGVQPGNNDAIPYFTASAARTESGDVPAVVFSTSGNPNLKPERSTELELGVDGTYFNNRVNTEITYYNKKSYDALVSRVLPPSLGAATSRLENLGEVSNVGWEALISAQIIDRDAFGWDVTVNGSTNSNMLVSLGGLPAIVSSSTVQQREGYPLNGWWSRGLSSFQDKNGDGLITYNVDPNLSEITVTDTAVYLGYSIPKYEVSLTNGFEFWKHRFHVGAMLDYKGDLQLYNNTERIRCLSRNNCSGLLDPNSSLFLQARSVAGRDSPAKTVAGFIEPGDFIRFRELNVTFTAPDQWASRVLRGKKLSATLAARNLGILWTKYSGVDPEAFGTTGDSPSEFQAYAPPTYYALRLSLGF